MALDICDAWAHCTRVRFTSIVSASNGTGPPSFTSPSPGGSGSRNSSQTSGRPRGGSPGSSIGNTRTAYRSNEEAASFTMQRRHTGPFFHILSISSLRRNTSIPPRAVCVCDFAAQGELSTRIGASAIRLALFFRGRCRCRARPARGRPRAPACSAGVGHATPAGPVPLGRIHTPGRAALRSRS